MRLCCFIEIVLAVTLRDGGVSYPYSRSQRRFRREILSIVSSVSHSFVVLACLPLYIAFCCVYDCPFLRSLPRGFFFSAYAFLYSGCFLLLFIFPSVFIFYFICLPLLLILPGDDAFLWLLFLSILSFCLLSLLFSPTVFPAWFGLVPPIL